MVGPSDQLNCLTRVHDSSQRCPCHTGWSVPDPPQRRGRLPRLHGRWCIFSFDIVHEHRSCQCRMTAGQSPAHHPRRIPTSMDPLDETASHRQGPTADDVISLPVSQDDEFILVNSTASTPQRQIRSSTPFAHGSQRQTTSQSQAGIAGTYLLGLRKQVSGSATRMPLGSGKPHQRMAVSGSEAPLAPESRSSPPPSLRILRNRSRRRQFSSSSSATLSTPIAASALCCGTGSPSCCLTVQCCRRPWQS
jgi:hypothetical protein